MQFSTKFLSSTISSVFKECAQPSGPARRFGARAARCRHSSQIEMTDVISTERCLPVCNNFVLSFDNVGQG